MVEDHYRLKRLEMALAATRFLLKSTRICNENMPKTTRLATLPDGLTEYSSNLACLLGYAQRCPMFRVRFARVSCPWLRFVKFHFMRCPLRRFCGFHRNVESEAVVDPAPWTNG